mgnify:CR=1 FL=1
MAAGHVRGSPRLVDEDQALGIKIELAIEPALALPKPVALYSDKHGVFRNNTASANGDGMTHFERALEKLNIDIICAHPPQAKGRFERVNGTLHDRLVKAVGLQGSRPLPRQTHCPSCAP